MANTKYSKIIKITETLANGYSFESTQREISNEYKHDRDVMFSKNLCVLVLKTKLATASERSRTLYTTCAQ